MSTDNLRRYCPPEPPTPPACAACRAFRPEALVPDGDGCVELCWLCAHHVTEHEVALEHAGDARCKCRSGDIYPADVLARRQYAAHAEPTEGMESDPNRVDRVVLVGNHSSLVIVKPTENARRTGRAARAASRRLR